jgi:hypothetical protein
MRRVVELRVHGVSGTPPTELLDRAEVRRVDQSGPTGFYRPSDPQQVRDHNGPQRPEAYLEGYAWGGLTSGAASRALWLLLLPFALVNLAPRLRPVGDVRSASAVQVLLTLSRLLAIALTATFTVAAAGVGVDLIAWQCGGEPGRCAALPQVVALTSWTPGHRLLLGLVLPLLVLGAVYVLSRATAARYEQIGGAADSDVASPDDVDPDLRHPWMWRGDYMVRRLRSVHLQVGLLAVVVLLSGSLVDSGYRRIVSVVALATIAAGALLLAPPRIVGRRARPPLWWLPRLLWVPTTVAVALVVWPLAADPRAVRPDRGGALRSYDALITWLFAGQLAIVVGMGAAALVLARRSSPSERSRQSFHGFGTVLVSALACLLGAAFSAGVYISAASWLTSGVLVPDLNGAPRGGEALLLPLSLQVTAVAFLGAAIICFGAGLAVAPRVATGWRRSSRTADLLGTYAERDPHNPDPARDVQLRKIFWRAGLVDSADTPLTVLLGVLTAGAVAISALLLAAQWSTGARAVVASIASASPLDTLGAYVIVGLLSALTVIAFMALRAERTRRVVGILWDLSAFWPRSVHPLAPPCYAERTVPELITRIRQHTGLQPDPFDRADYPLGAVVLAGHSQGSVIAAATVLQLTTSERAAVDQLALLTYGSVLRRLYSRYFPAYLGLPIVDSVARAVSERSSGVPRWRNLWRLSDQIGGPVEFDPDTLAAIQRPNRLIDRRLTDPPYRTASASRPAGHSGYARDPAFQEQVGQLAAALPTGAPASPADGSSTLLEPR